MWHIFRVLLWQELQLLVAEKVNWCLPMAFALVIGGIAPLAIGPEITLLQSVAGGMIWMILLLASLLILPRFFEEDAADGTLAGWKLCSFPLVLIVIAKWMGFLIGIGLPLLVLTPGLALMFGLTWAEIVRLLYLLASGLPTIGAITLLVAALTIGLNQRIVGVIIAFPLMIPVLIFGTSAVLNPPLLKLCLLLLWGLTAIILPLSFGVASLLLKETD